MWKKLLGGKIAHIGTTVKGMVRTGENVVLKVDEENRRLSGRNHSATHLLQKALRTVLGTHVEQAGSYVDAARLRFDFSPFLRADTWGKSKRWKRLSTEQLRTPFR